MSGSEESPPLHSSSVAKRLARARALRGKRIIAFFVAVTIFWYVTSNLLNLILGESPRSIWTLGKFIGAAVFAAIVTTGSVFNARRMERMGEDAIVRKILEPSRLTGESWVMWTVLTGVAMGFGIGIPIGLLIAFADEADRVFPGSRVMSIVGFTGMTLLWTIPMAFIIRYQTVRERNRVLAEAAPH
jgi:hypothetical protein